MKFHPMDQVYIVSDTLAYGLPVGEMGYVTAVNRHVDTAFNYCVRVPSKKEAWLVPECDLLTTQEWTERSAEVAIRNALIDKALATGDKALFEAQTKETLPP